MQQVENLLAHRVVLVTVEIRIELAKVLLFSNKFRSDGVIGFPNLAAASSNKAVPLLKIVMRNKDTSEARLILRGFIFP